MTYQQVIKYLKRNNFKVKTSGNWIMAITNSPTNHAVSYDKLYDVSQTYDDGHGNYGLKIWLGYFDQ